MEQLSNQQLYTIDKLNNLKPGENCAHGCKLSCRRATEAASRALQGDFSDPVADYEECVNGLVISLTVQALREMATS